jgi:hypothetical protein
LFSVTGCVFGRVAVLDQHFTGVGRERVVFGQGFQQCLGRRVVSGDQFVDGRGLGIEVVAGERGDIGWGQRESCERSNDDERDAELADTAPCEPQNGKRHDAL